MARRDHSQGVGSEVESDPGNPFSARSSEDGIADTSDHESNSGSISSDDSTSDLEDATAEDDTIYDLPNHEALSNSMSEMNAAVAEARSVCENLSNQLGALTMKKQFEDARETAKKLSKWDNPAQTKIGIVGDSAAGLLDLPSFTPLVTYP